MPKPKGSSADDGMEDLSMSAHAYGNAQAERFSRILESNRGAKRDSLKHEFADLVERLDASRKTQKTETEPTNFLPLYCDDEFYRPADKYRPNSTPRSPFGVDTANDYSRIVHSSYFRKLQGKTQLFPVGESELLRTRLTHSLEVAEIAARLTTFLNKQYVSVSDRDTVQRHKIDISIVTAAALAHDIGHPPFGHSGEEVLNKMMIGYGGFEGNAQTLRILTKLENRLSRNFPPSHTPADVTSDPLGLNLLYRTIAATIKYDKIIPNDSKFTVPEKGIYADDRGILDEVKRRVIKGRARRKLKTIECQIMDLADDIAYSTYDLEDCMISKTATPLDVISANDDDLVTISNSVNTKFARYGYGDPEDGPELTIDEIQIVFFWIFKSIITFANEQDYNLGNLLDRSIYVTKSYRENILLSRSPMFRRRMTELLINKAVESCRIIWDPTNPELSKLEMGTAELLQIECLKAFNREKVIGSQRLRIHSRRSEVIVEALFNELANDDRGYLVDDDLREEFRNSIASRDEGRRMRFICDYIASMTDTKAVATFSKLRSDRFVSVFGLDA